MKLKHSAYDKIKLLNAFLKYNRNDLANQNIAYAKYYLY